MRKDSGRFSIKEIKVIGIFRQKAQYIHNIADFIVAHKITHSKLAKIGDEEIIELFSQIKGVGRWKVEMLLMFGLGREDVFAVDDLGIQKGMIKLFKLPKMKNKDLKIKMRKLSEKWSPYHTYACLYLWRSLD